MKALSIVLLTMMSLSIQAANYKASCISMARSKNMSSSATSEVCKFANKHTASCISMARAKNMSSDTTAEVCSSATSSSASCISMARAKYMSSDATTEACFNASSETASCIHMARSKNMSSDSTAEMCASQEPIFEARAVQSELDEQRLRVLLIDALVNIDSNPERAKAHIQNILLEMELD